MNNRANVPQCPKCGSSNVAWILYGEPCLTKELKADLDAGRVCLGGCCIFGDDPEWHCNDCETEFGFMD